jgi:hypothetical protein
MPKIQVTVRDGRVGRDPARVTPEGGEVLAEFERGSLLNIGDQLTLADGTPVVVIGETVNVSATGQRQTVHIGDPDFN